ncbi:MAG: bifunctional phosphoribosylaminoimidazolecarboxamide formyltransferase/IMP cyclohydrolase [Phycisphaeraceae bacterium]|nr:bifunctional phosphoribosylaminoimidazolecarboxamide formyltransferase/IMP cyclohydrolase [Phycisphaeraceae bacterium]
MPDLVPISRAILSVSDKTDLVPFARALASHGVEIISTGGTAQALAAAGIAVTPIDKVTGFPEIMGGRVKTLHPMVHGGLLGVRDEAEHAAAMKAHGIRPIDLVCINLYPFERTVSVPGVQEREAIEQIDIGGPSMIRSGAKNFEWVTVVTSPGAYDRVVGELGANNGRTTRRLRSELAAAAFARTAEYDSAIAAYLSRSGEAAFPQTLRLGYVKVDELRYGENPHQEAALYRDPASTGPSVVNARKLHGKELSYNNINDAAAALELVKALGRLRPGAVGAAVIKHTNPCGCACVVEGAGAVRRAVDLAIAGDSLAAYGGILAVNRVIDRDAAERICGPDTFLEVIVAPEFTPEALDMIRARWTGVRLLATGERAASTRRKLEYRSVPGGMLVQDRDVRTPTPGAWVHAAGPAPTAAQLEAAAMLEVVVRFVGSNAVVIGGDGGAGATVLHATGGGQVDRVTACKIAVEKAGGVGGTGGTGGAGNRAKGAIAVGDAFFPFPDGPKILCDAGVSMIVHPGGSKRDQETFDLCAARGVTCMTTGVRHFKH